MASGQRIISVDLGSYAIKIGEFLVGGDGSLVLLNYGIKDLDIDPNKNEEKFPFVMQSIQSLMMESGIRPGPAVLGISGQAVFTRFVKLPPVPPEQMQQMVGFEAQQNVPFPIEEVVWDYQLLAGEGGSETEALIVAVKSDIVEESNAALATVKLDAKVVDVAPLALINSFAYNYGDNQDCSLLIDIGAKTTNLLFIEGKKVFCRAIPIAGNLISQNICNEFQEPYTAAETLKRGKGFVGLGGAYADPDDQAAARISKIARSVFSRLHAEVSRSISFYRNQQNGAPPKIVYLTGGTSTLPYSDIFFKDKLNLPVEYFNPLANVSLAPQVNRAKALQEATSLAPLVGMALRANKGCPIEINLLPPSVKAKAEKAAAIPYFIGALIIWILLFALPIGGFIWHKGLIEDALEKSKKESGQLDKLSESIHRAYIDYDLKTHHIEVLKKVAVQRNFWPEILDDINQCVPREIWITSFAPVSPVLPPPVKQVSEKRGKVVKAKEKVQAVDSTLGKFTEIIIQGLVEIGGDGDKALTTVSAFREKLAAIPYFSNVETTKYEAWADNKDKVVLGFEMKIRIKPENTMEVTP